MIAELARLQFGREENYRPRWVEPKLRPQARAARLRFLSLLGEVRIVHRVGHQKLRYSVAEVVMPVLSVQRADGKDAIDHALQAAEEDVLQRKLYAAAS